VYRVAALARDWADRRQLDYQSFCQRNTIYPSISNINNPLPRSHPYTPHSRLSVVTSRFSTAFLNSLTFSGSGCPIHVALCV
jgi:hypothetical protein